MDNPQQPLHPTEEMGEGRTRTGRATAGCSKFPLPLASPLSHPTPSSSLPGHGVCLGPHRNLRAQTQSEGHFLCTASGAERACHLTPVTKHLRAQHAGPWL